ncbi:hypothetical protein K438DRAFT_1752685 [Mycena galopus ATCC 62051]|nr:hypothetical protein K438DRAFT_1752685 [Mycena galopus ATCC 62051]
MSEPENPEVPLQTEMAGKVKESRMACRNNCRRKGRKMRGRMCESGKEKVRKAEVKAPEVAEDVSPCNPILEHWHGSRNGLVTDIARAPETSEMAEVQGYAGNVKSEKDRPGGESKVDFTRRGFAGTVQYRPSCPTRETGAGMNRRIRPEESIMPEVVSANPPEESRGGSELVKGPRRMNWQSEGKQKLKSRNGRR